MELHPFAGVLANLPGNATIMRGGQIKKRQKSSDDLPSQGRLSTVPSEPNLENRKNYICALR